MLYEDLVDLATAYQTKILFGGDSPVSEESAVIDGNTIRVYKGTFRCAIE